MKVAFLGLGVMGYPMAGHLATHADHYRVSVYNRTTAKADRWVEQYGGSRALSPAAAAEHADFVFACVGNDADLRSVTTAADGAFETLPRGALFIDHTTASADVARELATLAAQQGCGFLDAPVSGGQAGAENGNLTVMVGGQQADFERAAPLLNHYAQSVQLMGPSGAGQLTKMVNQLCIAGLIQSLAEGLAFAINADLDAKQVFDVISKGAAQSWQMTNRHQTMLDNQFDFGFAVDWMRKDLSLCFAEAKRNGSDLPITTLIDRYYAEVQAAGGNRYDTSSLVTRLPRKDLA